LGRGRYENDNRESLGTKAEIMNPVVTADIKTNSGNVCEYWDASCHVQQGMDSIVENVVQAGENITSWGDSTTKWIQGGIDEAGENIQVTYVETIEKPIVETVENIQEGIDETIKGGQDFLDEQYKNAQDAYNATVKAAHDAAAATAKAAADAAAAAGEGVTSGINNTLKYGALAALGIVGVLLVSKK
tara:strand:+ start:569 stop:1132 length:564 start_codon:yes stop_codon:yes gene_type:complete